MSKQLSLLAFLLSALVTTSLVAQPPGGRGSLGFGGGPFGADPELAITHFMSFDKNRDGLLSRDELTAMLTQEGTKRKSGVQSRGQRGGFGGPPPGIGFGGPTDGFSPPVVGQIVPQFVVERLGLSKRQKTAVEKLQLMINLKLSKILSDDQLQQLRQPQPGGPPNNQGRQMRRGR